MTPEGEVKDMIKLKLAALGAYPAGSKQWETGWATSWYYMPVQNGMGVSGIPDFVGCHYGRFWAVEAKAPGKQSNPNQAQRIREIEKAGGRVWVVSSWDDLVPMCVWLRSPRG